MISTRFRAGILASAIGISAFFYGCDRLTPLPKAPPEIPSLAPARDELYIFTYGRLSMDAFERLRVEYPKVSANDLAALAMTTQWLMTKTPSGKTATVQETTRCVRALFTPSVSPTDLTAASHFLHDRFGIASLALLRQAANDAASAWAVDWNPSLVREYGISVPSPR